MRFDPETFFRTIAEVSRTEPETYRRLGFADFRLCASVVTDRGVRSFGLVLDGYDVGYAGEVDADAFGADAVLAGPEAAWAEMADDIAAHGGADRLHTLNALTIAGAPLEVRATDPLGRDRFFRYIETLQHLFDGWAARVAANA
jgi:hypothetical protein